MVLMYLHYKHVMLCFLGFLLQQGFNDHRKVEVSHGQDCVVLTILHQHST
jgi:hypothetical protein